MKQLQSKLWAKITALLLLTIFAIVLFFSGLGVLYLADQGGYSNPEGFAKDHIAGNAFYSAMNTAADYYSAILQQSSGGSGSALSYYEQQFSRENSNFFFTVQDDTGKTVFESPDQDETYQYTRSQEQYLSYNWRDVVEDDHVFASEQAYQEYLDALERQNFNIYDSYITSYTRLIPDSGEASQATEGLTSSRFTASAALATTEEPAASAEEDIPAQPAGDLASEEAGAEEVHAYISYQRFDYQHVTITGYIRSPLTAKDDIYQESYYSNLLVENRHALIAVAAVSFAVCLALFVFLLCAAGHKEGVEGIHLNWVDRIPLDLYLVLAVAAGGCIFAAGIELTNASIAIAVFAVAVLLVFAVLLIMSVFMTLATRFKSGAFWKNTIIFYILRFLARTLRAIGTGISYCAVHLPLYWQAGLIFVGISLAELFVLAAFSRSAVVVIWVIAKLAEAPLLVLLAVSLQKLKSGGEALAAGNLNASVDLNHMYGVLKHHGENLNSIAQGMQKAVQQQLKSERFRTDLITNVSHDIKTPLTSIINYVDLLKKEDVQPEKAKEYIAVLDRQSARLKKLTEDLVEASKASSGTLPVHLEAVDVNVLLSQVSGEYQSRFELCRLEPIVKLAPESPQILADGKLLWRVFDNLLSNICKYAMPGTRVYFTSEVLDSRVQISFKNISNYPLDITADELMERFVRGDSSRSTEGSGLGLSIAQSLTGLQKGSFDLVVDGDLFKANISFPLLNV
jgi:signal transduction histidine kinase